jgi:hypothetical protein
MSTTLPPLVPRDVVRARLLQIFPEGTPFRNYCTRGIADATVFTMLYIGAVEGAERFLAPMQVCRMSDGQALKIADDERLEYGDASAKAGFKPGTGWYAAGTREPIRDETLRQGLMPLAAALERTDIPTTSPKPRYALSKDFAALFAPSLKEEALRQAIQAWQKAHLSPAALARIQLLQAGLVEDPAGVSVEFPNGDKRHLSAGQSSAITKRVIEEFAPRFLKTPGVLWVSESGNKVVLQDDQLARRIRLKIDPARNLPDIILVDLGRPEMLLIFVEVVATDGPVSELRRSELLALAAEAGLEERHVAFVTAFMDRGLPAFRKAVSSLAWNSFAWLATEPEHLIALLELQDSVRTKLYDLLALARGDTLG